MSVLEYISGVMEEFIQGGDPFDSLGIGSIQPYYNELSSMCPINNIDNWAKLQKRNSISIKTLYNTIRKHTSSNCTLLPNKRNKPDAQYTAEVYDNLLIIWRTLPRQIVNKALDEEQIKSYLKENTFPSYGLRYEVSVSDYVIETIYKEYAGKTSIEGIKSMVFQY